ECPLLEDYKARLSFLSSSIRDLDIAHVSTRRYFRIQIPFHPTTRAAAAAHAIEMATMKRALIQVDLGHPVAGRVGRPEIILEPTRLSPKPRECSLLVIDPLMFPGRAVAQPPALAGRDFGAACACRARRSHAPVQ